MSEELTAWHEAGHAYAALFVGARVRQVTIDPDHDDGPSRTGDTTVLWSRQRFSERDFAEKAAWVSLAGPVAEMIFSERPFHPGTVAEWRHDWESAFEALHHIPQMQRRLARLERITVELYEAFRDDHHWMVIGAIADSLLAHETLDEDMLREIVEPWLGEA